MENLSGILERDYGFKSGKNAPMVSSSSGGSSGGAGYGGLRKSMPSGRMSGNSSSAFGQDDPFGIGRKNEGSKSSRSSYGSREDLFSASSYHDVFGGPPKMNDGAPRYDDVYAGAPQDGNHAFEDWGGFGGSTPKVKSTAGSFHSSPRPSDRNHFVSSDSAYDELIPGFAFMPKARANTEVKTAHEPDPFIPLGNDPIPSSSGIGSFDDGLLPGFGSESRSSSGDVKSSREPDPLMPLFDDPLPSSIPSASSPFVDDGLLPGFADDDMQSRSFRNTKVSSKHDSFESLGDDPMSSSIPSTSPAFDDLLNVFDEPQVPPSSNSSRGPSNGIKVDRFDGFESFPPSPVKSSFFKDSSRRAAEDAGRARTGTGSAEDATSIGGGFKSEDISELPPDINPFYSSHVDMSKSAGGLGSAERQGDELPGWDFASSDDQQRERGYVSNSRFKDLKDAWLTIEDLKLKTRPSPVPPPTRRPPSLPGYKEKLDSRDAGFVTSSSSTSTPEEDRTVSKSPPPPPYEQAVPGWMDFKPARDVERDREARAAREKRRQEREEAKASRENREKEIEEREAKQAREQERLRREKEREKDRAAVRVATLEARERAAQDAREKAERNAVERVTGEARVRAAALARAKAERAAVERATLEARERAESKALADKAAAEARERAERAAAEKAAAEKSAAELRERTMRAAAEKIAVERAQSEVRERAARAAAEKAAAERVAAEARERAEKAAAEKAARERSQQQHKSEDDLESFFNPPSTNESRRPASMNNVSNASVFGEPRRTSSGIPTTTASMDDWASIFGSSSNSDGPQDRKADHSRSSRARTERNLNTSQRAAKAIAEINQRDLESQREQAERQRAGDVLDGEIKRWAAGKEGNLRALLSTLQYVLWPESGWAPISLTDLINPNAVKKTYKKATLYVHPDKVQQKGATVQQKYIAEKVFDLLKEAFNKFNAEELF